ncbi:MAG: hypothetical protein JHD28_09935 [Bacteroidia bacterium]|nr:hypothetical protein [Bacteroidia bacterium]
MNEVYTIVECLVTYENGTSEIRRPTFADVSVGLAQVNHVSVINYLRENLQNVRRIEVLDTLYFRSREDYENYMNAQ